MKSLKSFSTVWYQSNRQQCLLLIFEDIEIIKLEYEKIEKGDTFYVLQVDKINHRFSKGCIFLKMLTITNMIQTSQYI